MIEQQARVTSIQGDRARVIVGGRSGCPACDAGEGCGAGIFGRLLQREPVELELDIGPGLELDEQDIDRSIVLGLRERDYLGLVLGLYGLPLLAGLGGALLTHHALESTLSPLPLDLMTLLGAVLAGSVALRLVGSKLPSGLAPSILARSRLLPTADPLDCRVRDHH